MTMNVLHLEPVKIEFVLILAMKEMYVAGLLAVELTIIELNAIVLLALLEILIQLVSPVSKT